MKRGANGKGCKSKKGRGKGFGVFAFSSERKERAIWLKIKPNLGRAIGNGRNSPGKATNDPGTMPRSPTAPREKKKRHGQMEQRWRQT